MLEQDKNDKKKGSNIGCLIVVILFVIASIIYGIRSNSYEDFSEFGGGLLAIGGLVAAYFILKYFGVIKESGSSSSGNKHTEVGEKGCSFKTVLVLLGVLLFFGLMAYLFSSSTELNYAVGIGVFVVFAIVIGILFYTNMKDN